eukprot:TRINITY_DN6678_c0_g1_i2.p1 TRINITY_DN6678_c0_g1~~TRINITY_DN6678_c0_g1_i2.p1  ORF type:complete len:205 (+),score=46.67 TRINITY_DN6678_c0_g1_i2:143-757(+)
MSFQQDYDYLFKLLLVGNSAVGKSSILLRFTDNIFNDSFLPTIGVDFKIRTYNVGGKQAKLQIWDTAGQERFKTITSTYYKGAHGIMLVYDVTDRQSFRDVENWVQEVEKQASENVVKVLIGNKCDLDKERQVTFDEGKEYADSIGIKFLETSAKAATNIDKVFQTVANEIKARIGRDGGETRQEEGRKRLAPVENQPNKTGCC